MGAKSSKPPKFEEIHDGDTSTSKDNYLKPGSKGTWNKSMESLSKMSNKTSSSFTMVRLYYYYRLD